MDNTKQLEQKLEELIEQLNELLAQLSKDNDIPVKENGPEKTVENLSKELQRLQSNRMRPRFQTPMDKAMGRDNGYEYY